mmetsp:Transcript_25124/g.34463  ORF Transcript_25124/g.34463 Transcript_25124/m.34463 type:complete len:249 (+) Transcript_25124:264-1010(+)
MAFLQTGERKSIPSMNALFTKFRTRLMEGKVDDSSCCFFSSTILCQRTGIYSMRLFRPPGPDCWLLMVRRPSTLSWMVLNNPTSSSASDSPIPWTTSTRCSTSRSSHGSSISASPAHPRVKGNFMKAFSISGVQPLAVFFVALAYGCVSSKNDTDMVGRSTASYEDLFFSSSVCKPSTKRMYPSSISRSSSSDPIGPQASFSPSFQHHRHRRTVTFFSPQYRGLASLAGSSTSNRPPRMPMQPTSLFR